MTVLRRFKGAFRAEQAGPRATNGAAPYEIWGQTGWANVDIVGESFCTREIRRLLADNGVDGRADGGEVWVPVTLVHNPHNPHDANAVEIHGSTGLLGHLSRSDAARYVPVLAQLRRQERVATTGARVWGRQQQAGDPGPQDFFCSVKIDLPEPHMMTPRNRPPATPHELLPSGTTIRVPNKAASLPDLVPGLVDQNECWVYATLHHVVDKGPRVAKNLVEARIDGTVAGRLTPKMSEEMLPVVQFLADRGLTTCVRAAVKGNALRTDVVLHTTRAAGLPGDWFDRLPGAVDPSILAADSSGHNTNVPVGQAPPPSVPAGWYTDPYRAARLRLWDGSSWTGQTRR
jgi:Protein of unknown function (DUF2510)